MHKVVVLVLVLFVATPAVASDYPWLVSVPARSVAEIPPPAGYGRVPLTGFGAWLRGLPLLPAGSPLRLHDGKLRDYQDGHHAIVDLDVPKLQQCADAILRLRAEWLWSLGRRRDISFRLGDGTEARFTGSGRVAFMKYLHRVFAYAGTETMVRDYRLVDQLGPGHFVVQPPRPREGAKIGHALLVLDAAEDRHGNRMVLLGQGFTPAQQFHVVRNLNHDYSPWYRADDVLREGLRTPSWRKKAPFRAQDVRTFDGPGSASGSPRTP